MGEIMAKHQRPAGVGYKNVRRWLSKFAGLFLVVGCATTETAVPKEPHKTHYTLSKGETTIHPGLLPRETPVNLEWHYSNGDKKAHRGFTGWDFDGDGRYEMVEVLAEDSSMTATVFDFDGDGKIDARIESNAMSKPAD